MEDVWGLVANEAVLSGLPVLCSTHAGCAPELFDPEAIFAPANEQEYAEGLRRTVVGRLLNAVSARFLRSAELARRIADAVRASIDNREPSTTGSLNSSS